MLRSIKKTILTPMIMKTTKATITAMKGTIMPTRMDRS